MSSLVVQMTVADLEAAVQRAVAAALAGKPLADIAASVAAGAAKAGKKEKKPKKERDPSAPKKEPNEWIKFTQRVRELLPLGPDGKKLGVIVTQFCGDLKEKLPKKEDKPDYSAITDEAILAAWSSWEKPEHSKQELAGKNKSAGSSVAGSKKDDDSDAESDSESKASGGEKKKRQWSPEAKARAAEKRALKKAAAKKDGESDASSVKEAEEKPQKAAPKTAVAVVASAPKAVSAVPPPPPAALPASAAPSDDEDEEEDIQAFNELEDPQFAGKGYHVNCRGDVVDGEMNWVGKYNFAKKTLNKKATKPEDLDI